LAGRPDRRLSRNICRLVFPAVSGPRSTRAMVRPLGLIGKFGASGTGRERSGDDDWKGNGGSPESAPYQYHFGRPAGPSHRFFPARTMKMPSSGSSGAMDGTGQIGFFSSKTTPEPSGSTARSWKTPAMPEMVYMFSKPKLLQARHIPFGSGTGVGAATSMTVTGSQFPRRTRSFCPNALRPWGSVVHSVTT